MSAGGYTAFIRWSTEGHPEWELETVHQGFATARAAALFANAYEGGPESLRLKRGGVSLRLSTGEVAPVPAALVSVWRVNQAAVDDAEQGHPIAWDDDYDQVPMTALELSRSELDGVWAARGWLVEGPHGPVNLNVEQDELGNVMVEEVPAGELELDGEVFAAHPRA